MNVRLSLRSSGSPTDFETLRVGKSWPIEIPFIGPPSAWDCASTITLITSCVALSSSYKEFASEILVLWVAIVGCKTLTSRVFESTTFVKYETTSTVAGEDFSIPSLDGCSSNSGESHLFRLSGLSNLL
ncbi:hypothetical protein LINPERPRIM_LOCUS29166, partial [Linum perenne]